MLHNLTCHHRCMSVAGERSPLGSYSCFQYSAISGKRAPSIAGTSRADVGKIGISLQTPKAGALRAVYTLSWTAHWGVRCGLSISTLFSRRRVGRWRRYGCLFHPAVTDKKGTSKYCTHIRRHKIWRTTPILSSPKTLELMVKPLTYDAEDPSMYPYHPPAHGHLSRLQQTEPCQHACDPQPSSSKQIEGKIHSELRTHKHTAPSVRRTAKS